MRRLLTSSISTLLSYFIGNRSAKYKSLKPPMFFRKTANTIINVYIMISLLQITSVPCYSSSLEPVDLEDAEKIEAVYNYFVEVKKVYSSAAKNSFPLLVWNKRVFFYVDDSVPRKFERYRICSYQRTRI
jgi:hypothetical protein